MKKISFILLFGVALVTQGCKSFLDGNEISPNSPVSATPALLLSTVEVSTFANFSGQLSRSSSILMQQSQGVLNQAEDVAIYTILEGDNTNEWSSIYTGALNNSKALMDLAGDKSPNYRGIAKILYALNLGLATDIWGDVPNSDALKGLTGQIDAKYDSQEAIYAAIQAMLSDAIVDLGKTSNLIEPGDDDYIFKGDTDKWIATANALKARYANHLSKKSNYSPTTVLANANAALATMTANGAADAKCVFTAAGNELNQWYAYNDQRGDYIKMGKFFIDLMANTNDPRLAKYATKDAAGGYSGSPLANDPTSKDRSAMGTYFGTDAAPIPLVTYVELKFIQAEAMFRMGNKIDAATAFNTAVIDNITQVTGAAPTAAYIAASASETDATITLEKIMTQKYIAMFTQPEVWTDWRRTGFPTLAADTRGAVIDIPRRFPTPLTERLYNPKATVISNILTKMWWDN